MEIKGSNVNSKLKIKEDLQIGKKLAKEIMLFADDNSSAVSKKEFQNKLNKMEKLSTQNLIKFIRSFDKDESVIELIVDEVGSSKDERKNACKKVLSALTNKAKELGIDTKDLEQQFIKELNRQFDSWGLVNTEKLDKIINALTQSIENRQNFTPEDIARIQNTPTEVSQEQANNVIENRLEKAYAAFGERVDENGEMSTRDKNGNLYNGQMQRDGIAADIADGVSRIWGSENTAAKVRKDLKAANAQLQQLKGARSQGEEAYKAKFKEIFGVEYDYANIVAYQKAEQVYVNASASHEFEMSFNRTLKTLLSPAPLREEVRYDSPGPMTNQVITTVTATKSQVYSREFNNLAEFLTQKDSNGNVISGTEILNKAFEEKGVAKGTIEEKFEVLKQIAQALSKQLHSATLEAGGGKEFSEVQAMYDNSYKAAYGIENDIMKRVTDYNVSQEMGAGVVKAGTTIAVSLIAAFTGIGLVGVAAWTAGATVATEVIDRGTSGNALNALREQGLGEYLETVGKDVDWEATFKQAAMSGVAVLIGGGVAQGVTAIMKGSSSVAQFAAMLGSDVITDATMEFFMTKQITWEGMVFTVLLSTIGNAAQLKQMKNVAATNTAKSVDNEPSLKQVKDIANDVSVKSTSENLIKTFDAIDSTKFPNEFKTTWEKCKREILSILKQIENGVTKLDKKMDEAILYLRHISANISGKIKNEIDNLIEELNDFVRRTKDKLDSIPIEKQLKNIKNTDGSHRYTDSEIELLLANIPTNLNFTKKELVDLMNLNANTVNDAIDLIAKIDTDDKFKILNILTSQRNSNNSEQIYNFFEIDNFFDNLEDCKITNRYKFFENAINDYKYFGENVISQESYLNELSYHLKTDEQTRIYTNIISRIKKGKCKMLPAEIFKYLDLKNETFVPRMYDTSSNIINLQSEIKNLGLSTEQELLLAFIDDEYILKYLKYELPSMDYWESLALLRSVTEADATLFSGDLAFYSGDTNLQNFYNYAEKNGINIDDIETKFRHPNIESFNAAALPIDMELAARFNHLREYIGRGTSEEVKNYLYNNLYLKTLKEFGISPDIIFKLDKINKDYNVKIMISSNLKECDNVLKYIETELQEWHLASNGAAKMPPVIDFNSADLMWYDTGSTQAGTVAGGYSSLGYNGLIALNEQTKKSVVHAIRHEITHTNDLKLGDNIDPKYLKVDQDGNFVLDKYGAVKPKRTKELEKELRNAGIKVFQIDYAFINTKEFIAVASEGNMSKYSAEFKEMLIEFGMPQWMFNMKSKNEIDLVIQ